jgi:hypothetical protein
MKWKYIAASMAGVSIVLAVFLFLLSRVPLQVRISGGQLEVVRMVEMTATPEATGMDSSTNPTAAKPTLPLRPSPGPTYTPEAPPLPILIDPMEDAAGWDPYFDGKSAITVTAASGMTGGAVQIAFDLQEWGWMGISKEIDPQVLQGTEGVRFFYRGSGAPNTIEFKMLYAPNRQGESAIFSVLWPAVTVTEDWKMLEVRYDELGCWKETPCPIDGKFDPQQAWRIDFAVSNKAQMGDTPGAGIVAIDEVQGVR